MIRWSAFLLGALVTLGIFGAAYRLFWRRQSRRARGVGAFLAVCALFVSFAGTGIFPTPARTLELTALGEKNPAGAGVEIYLTALKLDGERADLPAPDEGAWVSYRDWYCWFKEGDERREADTTQRVVIPIPTAWDTELDFLSNKWKGVVQLRFDGTEQRVDTFSAKEDGSALRIQLPHPTVTQAVKAVLFPTMGYALVLLGITLLVTALAAAIKAWGGFPEHLTEKGPFRKLSEYQFLFEELIKRDFKKKYKRTVLGMVWSVLSPLLTLLVMRLVFTQFFGRNTAHYTIYLFCGNLVFSYFNESTAQGMTSLVSNASIFTKVNVPKYLFLFSKNVQTLINFGLTLIVFFAFCVMDNITFTWKFILLLYPIIMLLLFNLGVGLILSALFVFFKDIQYLWSVFTMLLMYMSAIFYNIDSYSPMIQNLFLANPVYLFIRYFRKIVIEATVPTVWFHLLMLADVVIVLGLGCWIYKKNNTKFLYYV